MTEKRYSHDGVVIKDHLKKDLIYIEGRDDLLELAEYVKELQDDNKKLKEENQELTQKKNDLKDLLVNSEPVLEQKELQKIIFKMVYAAIDDKIKEAEEGFQQTYDSWYQGQIDALKELKKEFPYD